MSKHTTPLPHADQTGLQAAEPAPRASRFDQRGIALQTVIIMVVLLAIAGGIAAVLLSRGQSASQQLEAAALATPVDTYEVEAFCVQAGHFWNNGDDTCRYRNKAACEAAGGTVAAGTNPPCMIGGVARGLVNGTVS